VTMEIVADGRADPPVCLICPSFYRE